MKIGILTDSTCDLDQSLLHKYNIEVIPLNIKFENDVYIDGVDLDSREFFQKLISTETIPGTSCPSIGVFIQKYREMTARFDRIISIHVSSRLSSTYKTARMAARQLTDIDIQFVDSRSISLGLGFLVLLAARLNRAGKSVEKIVSTVKKTREKLLVYFTVDELKYMEQGGRIGKASSFLGTIFNINPIISISPETGQVLPLGKSRGQTRTMERMVEMAVEKLGDEQYAWLGFAYGSRKEDAELFQQKLQQQIDNRLDLKYDTYQTIISPTLGCHVGPTVYAGVILAGSFLQIGKGTEI